uniref:Reverse transcriptase domain-containing protein n=1 Tax=Amphimedon queenslandica TaxID=400682 RepID=A0A1X7T0K7_AMPQE
MRPLVKHVRAQGIRLVLYLDDGIVVVKNSQSIASSISNEVQQVLTDAGLIVSIEKSSFEPSLQAAWLGFDIDLTLGSISIPQNKISNLKTLLKNAIGESSLPVRSLAHAIVKTKEGEKLRTLGSISYTQVREILLKLRCLGYEASEFGTHSIRAGRGTTAANQGVPDSSRGMADGNLRQLMIGIIKIVLRPDSRFLKYYKYEVS